MILILNHFLIVYQLVLRYVNRLSFRTAIARNFWGYLTVDFSITKNCRYY